MRTLLLLMICSACVSPAEAQVILRLKFKDGDVIQQVMNQEVKSSATFNGQQMNTDMLQALHIEHSIGTVAEDGSAVVVQTIKSMKMSMQTPLGQGFKYDSDSDTNQLPPGLGETFDKLVGAEFQATLLPTGQMTDVSIPEDLKQVLQQMSGSPLRGADDNALQQMMGQSSMAFPEEPVSVGDEWEDDLTMRMPFGQLNVHRTSTYQGTNDDGLHVIDLKMEMNVEPSEDAQATMKLGDSEGTGTLLFDNARGRIVSVEVTKAMDMEVSASGQTINSEVTTKMTLKEQTERASSTTLP